MSRATRPLQLRDANGWILPFNPADFKMRVKYVGNTFRYYGKSRPGAAETAAAWRIEKEIVNASGNTISIDYANGLFEYDSIWDSGASLVISGATQANPCVVTVSSTATLSNDDVIYIDSVGGMTELNSEYFLITVLDGTTVSLQNVDTGVDVNSGAYGAYTAGGVLYRPDFCNYSFS